MVLCEQYMDGVAYAFESVATDLQAVAIDPPNPSEIVAHNSGWQLKYKL